MKSYTAFLMLLVFVAMATAAQRNPVDCRYTRPDCYCLSVWDPVCATNGCTYGNICQMECAGAKYAYKGECRRV